MLIDFPKEKEKVIEFFTKYIIAKKKQLSPSSSLIPRVKVFEGHKQLLIREDRTREETEFKLIKSEMRYNIKEIENIALANSMENMFKKLDEIARELASKEFKMVFDKIDEAVERVGNVVSAKGRPFTESFFETIEKIQIDFDENGKIIMPKIILNPKTAEEIKLRDKLREIETNPSYKMRFEEIIEKKWEEWRDRKSARRLVG